MKTIRYDEVIRFKAPSGFSSAVAAAAYREHQSTSEFLRQTVFERLRAAGVPLSSMMPWPLGNLARREL
jgi:hypothetical protein